jgi:hypothetical protein
MLDPDPESVNPYPKHSEKKTDCFMNATPCFVTPLKIPQKTGQISGFFPSLPGLSKKTQFDRAYHNYAYKSGISRILTI